MGIGDGEGLPGGWEAVVIVAAGDDVDVDHWDGERLAPVQDHGVFVVEGVGDWEVHSVGYVRGGRLRLGDLLLPGRQKRGGQCGVCVAVHRVGERGHGCEGAFWAHIIGPEWEGEAQGA